LLTIGQIAQKWIDLQIAQNQQITSKLDKIAQNWTNKNCQIVVGKNNGHITILNNYR